MSSNGTGTGIVFLRRNLTDAWGHSFGDALRDHGGVVVARNNDELVVAKTIAAATRFGQTAGDAVCAQLEYDPVDVRGETDEIVRVHKARIVDLCDPVALIRNAKDLRGAFLSGVSIGLAQMQGADLRGARLARASVCGVDFTDANMMYMYARGTQFRGCVFVRANLEMSDLRCADLENAVLCGANLYRVDLRDTLLWRANLRGANLQRADLRDANLTFADLRGADLRNAYLRNANLYSADLRGADLTDADLTGAQLQHVQIDDLTRPEDLALVSGRKEGHDR